MTGPDPKAKAVAKPWAERHPIAAAVIPALIGAAIASWITSAILLGRMESRIESLQTAIRAVEVDVQGVRRAVGKIATDPTDKQAILELLTRSEARPGADLYREGDLLGATEFWTTAAAAGNSDAKLGVIFARNELRRELSNPQLPSEEREQLTIALTRLETETIPLIYPDSPDTDER